MLKSAMVTSLLLSSSLIISGCRPDEVQGVLVGAFADEDRMITTILTPSSADGKYPMHFELRQSDRVCLLTGEISDENIPFLNICSGLKGSGTISCNDGRALDLQWSLSSCQGGSGHSTNQAGSHFLFGFEQNEAKALAQLKKAQRDLEKSAEPPSTHFLWH